MVQLVFQIGHAAQRLDEFFAQDLSVTAAEPGYIRFHRAFGHAKLDRDFPILGGGGFAWKELFEHLKAFSFADFPEFLAQTSASFLQERQRPSAVIRLVRAKVIRRLE